MFRCLQRRITPSFLLLAVLAACPAAAAERVRLDTRPGVTVAMYVETARNAKATVVLLPGGNGRVKIDKRANIRNDRNFVVRSRGLFVAAGYNVVLPDAPSDRQADGLGGKSGSAFRLSNEHMADLAKIVAYARKRFGKPVVVVGMSRGSISLATFLKERPGSAAAAAFVSSVISGKLDGSLHRADLSAIAGPVLFVHHRNDACKVSKPKVMKKVVGKFGATNPELIWIDGNGAANGRECGPYHYHGFEGQEEEAVTAITDWIARTVR